MMNKNGSALILLLLGILLAGYLYLDYGSSLGIFPVPSGPQTASQTVHPIQKSWDAVCQVNKAAVVQAIQMYNISHPPMKVLDMNALATVLRLPDPPHGCPCKYSLDERGNVVCSIHH